MLVELKCRQLLHVTYKLFLVSIALQNAGILSLCIAYGNYASNGIGLPNIKLLGNVLHEPTLEGFFFKRLYHDDKGVYQR